MTDPLQSGDEPNTNASPVAGKVLVAEADPLFGRILKRKLERWGYQVLLENTGHGAFAFFKADNYRVVITSADLPGMNGVDLCRHVRAQNRPNYTYILFTAAEGDKDALVAGLAAGADEFMTKPLNALELGLRMKNAERLLALDDKVNLGGGIDMATGVLTRYAFRQFFTSVYAKALRDVSPGVLLFVTIENDSDIFARYGFEAAFLMHKAVVDAVQPALRQSDLFARVDDNGFCLLLNDMPRENIKLVSERVHELLDTVNVEFEGQPVPCEISLAATVFPQRDMDSQQVVYNAARQPCPRGDGKTKK